MMKEKVEELRLEYLRLLSRDGRTFPKKEEWFVSSTDDLHWYWPCPSKAVAFAKAAYWNASEELEAKKEGRQPRRFVVQRKVAPGKTIVVDE